MKFDEFDVAIIKTLSEIKKGETSSTTDLAKIIFEDDKGDVHKLRKRDNFLRNRMKKLLKIGIVGVKFNCVCRKCGSKFTEKTIKKLFVCNDCGSEDIIVRSSFFLEKNKVKFGEADIKVRDGDALVPFCTRDILMLDIDGSWSVVEL